MEIAIYQINCDRDKNRVSFSDYDSTVKFQNSNAIDCEIYDKVFEGNVDCNNLEEVYQIFNIDYPEGYTGHSLSVSDIVEVKGGSPLLVGRIRFYNSSDHYEDIEYTDPERFKRDIVKANYVGRTIDVEHLEDKNVPMHENGFYFCDSHGFKKVEFTPHDTLEQTTEQDKKAITVVIIEPGKLARVADIGSSLEGMQAVVNGMIEPFYPYEEEACIVCNEEGKINGSELNRAVYGEDGKIIDIIAGTAFICDCSGESFGSLTSEQQEKYLKQFKYPEQFFKFGNEIRAIPYRPNPARDEAR